MRVQILQKDHTLPTWKDLSYNFQNKRDMLDHSVGFSIAKKASFPATTGLPLLDPLEGLRAPCSLFSVPLELAATLMHQVYFIALHPLFYV